MCKVRSLYWRGAAPCLQPLGGWGARRQHSSAPWAAGSRGGLGSPQPTTLSVPPFIAIEVTPVSKSGVRGGTADRRAGARGRGRAHTCGAAGEREGAPPRGAVRTWPRGPPTAAEASGAGCEAASLRRSPEGAGCPGAAVRGGPAVPGALPACGAHTGIGISLYSSTPSRSSRMGSASSASSWGGTG